MEIIHIVLGKANPERMNGVNKVVHEMALQQKQYGMKVSVWGITADTTENFPERAFKTVLFKSGMTPFSMPQGFASSVLNQPCDTVFHIHGGWVPLFATLSAYLHRHGYSYVFTPHGAYNTIAMQRSKWVKKAYFRLFERRLLSNAATVHHIGLSETTGLRSIWKGGHITQLPYGFKAANSLPAKPDHTKFVLGFIGRLDIYTKGLDLLLEAYRQVEKDMPESELWITGDSDERPRLEQLAADLTAKGRVIFTGSKFGDEKTALLTKMDVFVHPSRNEGLPASVLEASAAGKPCIVSIATNLGTEITRWNAGVTVSDENIHQLAEAIKKMYKTWKQGNLAHIGENGIKMVHEEFAWQSLLPRYQAMYEAVLPAKIKDQVIAKL